MNKITVFLFALIWITNSHLYSQDGDCPRISVGVDIDYFSDDAFEKIKSDNPGKSQDKSFWISEIQNKTINALRNNNPSVHFVNVMTNTSESYEYIYIYGIKGAQIAEEDYDPSEVAENKYKALYYDVLSNINSLSKCGSFLFVGEHIETKSREISVAVEANVADHFSIQKKILEFEENHPAPPRDPKMTVELDPDFVSPLKDERSLNVKVSVVNCKGEPVYSRDFQQDVYFSPKESKRGEFRAKPPFFSGNMEIAPTDPSGKAEAKYRLNRGTDAATETVKILT